MKYTNQARLPEPLFKAVCNDSYSAGDSYISVTGLIGPARIRQLKRKHDEHLTEDASDRIWSLMGQIGHGILERSGELKNTEQRMYIERRGLKIGGQIDLIDNGIFDYKFCKINVAKDGPKQEWIWQQNIYRAIAMANGYTGIDKLQIVAIYRDWTVMQTARQDYPPRQVQAFELPIYPAEKVEAYIDERLAVHIAAETELPECTAEERWQKPEKWALMKKGRKTAIKLYDSEEQATKAISDPAHYTEIRPSVPHRCMYFCPVVAFCSFGREYLQEKTNR